MNSVNIGKNELFLSFASEIEALSDHLARMPHINYQTCLGLYVIVRKIYRTSSGVVTTPLYYNDQTFDAVYEKLRGEDIFSYMLRMTKQGIRNDTVVASLPQVVQNLDLAATELNNVYYITNRENRYGAISLLDTKVLSHLANYYGSDIKFFGNVHGVIAYPESNKISKDGLLSKIKWNIDDALSTNSFLYRHGFEFIVPC